MIRDDEEYMNAFRDDSTEDGFQCHNCNPEVCPNYRDGCYVCEDYHGIIQQTGRPLDDEYSDIDLDTLNAEWGPDVVQKPDLDIAREFSEE